MNLSSPISTLSPFVKRLEKKLNNLEIKTIQDLILYFPYRYDDLSKILTISELTSNDTATIKAKIQFIKNFRSPVKKTLITEALLADGSGSIRVVWFNQSFLIKILKAGDEIYLSGKVSQDRTGLFFNSPIYEPVREVTTHTGRIVPIYPLTSRLTEKQIRAAIKQALTYVEGVEEWMPPHILQFYNLMNLRDALIYIHFPTNADTLARSEFRIKFNQLFLIQMTNALLKSEFSTLHANAIKFFESETRSFVNSLPFKLTNSQRKVAWEILKDLEKAAPMNRLLNGDVGSGKTIVAGIAILNSALNGFQTAFLAPTEILSRQHFNTSASLFNGWDMRLAHLSASNQEFIDCSKNHKERIEKNELKNLIKKGKVDLVIGTHALLQDDINFKNLSLVIVDEQHRFGVEQRHFLSRERAADSSRTPHFLSMTATPIPRTLALTVYSDLDLSILDEMPIGRKVIHTKLVLDNERGKTYAFVRDEVRQGRQVFCICPLIDPSDVLEVKSVKETAEYLQKSVFPDLNVRMLHGKLKSKEKEAIMNDFLDHKFDILVSTSVVEVGVDIPNASVIMIEGAERFGLAQLHQFRGRVGRGKYQSYCFLFSSASSKESLARLKVIETTHNGFMLAEKDLEFRGSGELFGTKQWGFEKNRFLDFSDPELINITREAARELISRDKTFSTWPALRNKVEEFMEEIHPE